jgi:DNA polymerase III gamma/tau subunit
LGIFFLKTEGRDIALRDVIGQDRAVGMLLGAIRRGRVASSYLFTGESGIGKKFTALNLAKAINCPGGIGDQGIRVRQ